MQALHYRCYSAQPSSGVWVKFLQIDSFHQCRASCALVPLLIALTKVASTLPCLQQRLTMHGQGLI